MIKYLPNLDTLLWSLKSIELFDTLDDLQTFIADQRTRVYRYIGKDQSYQPADVKFQHLYDRDPFMGWRNYSSIMLDGVLVGHCGE